MTNLTQVQRQYLLVRTSSVIYDYCLKGLYVHMTVICHVTVYTVITITKWLFDKLDTLGRSFSLGLNNHRTKRFTNSANINIISEKLSDNIESC